MKHIVCLLIALFALPVVLIAGTAGRVVYVSASAGSDSNSGIAETAPLRTIKKAVSLRPEKILLKCGDVFSESASLDSINLDAYGKGAMPMLCGYKYAPADKGMWCEGLLANGVWKPRKGSHIWRIDLEASAFTGRNDIKSQHLLNNIGFLRNLTTGEFFGRKTEFINKSDCNDPNESTQRNTFFTTDGDFWQSGAYNRRDVTDSEVRYLYLYSTSDPNLSEWAMATYGNGITAHNSKIANIRVEGFGSHGFACRSNTRVEHCEIEYIGGSNLFSFSKWVRYGNGVEYYGSQQHGYVANNFIAHVYDTATTIQSSLQQGEISDIVFEKNLIRNCRQDFEIFLPAPDADGRTFDCSKCSFRKNKCYDAGDNGFGCPDISDTHIVANLAYYPATGLVIEKNTFTGGYGYLAIPKPHNLHIGKGNVYRFDVPVVLWSGRWRDNRISASSGVGLDEAIKLYREKTGDYNTRFVQLQH